MHFQSVPDHLNRIDERQQERNAVFFNQRHRKLDILLFNPLPHREICHCTYKGISLGAAKCCRSEVQEYNLKLAVNKNNEQLPRWEKLSNR